jgi:hypothetical protein
MSDLVWLNYRELGERLRTSAEGARRRALRAHWPRRPGNDKKKRVGVPADVLAELAALLGERSPPARPGADGPADNPVHAQIARLEAELAGMREALAEARARAGGAEEHIESLRAQIVAAEARAAAADGRAVEEAAKTAQAIAAFEGLAQRLEAFAEAQNAKTLHRWWRRIVRRGCERNSDGV